MTKVFLIALGGILMLFSNSFTTDSARQKSDAKTSILQAKGETVKVRLFDAFSSNAIANTQVNVQSDNGIRCIKAPCPTNSQTWTGKTDNQGYVLIPRRMLQQVTNISTPDHKDSRNLTEAEQDKTGAWLVELVPNHVYDGPTLGSRAIKLIDARTNRPLANRDAKVSFNGAETLELKTNALGYIFVPLELAEEDTQVEVPGYKNTRLDFAAAQYKTKLIRN